MRHFDRELEQLKCKLLEMSSLVETAIHHSITAVVQKDPSLAEDVLKNEARINQMEIEIDDLAIKLLALQQPMAVDLRLITAALKINNDLERMGDLAVNIAQRALELISPFPAASWCTCRPCITPASRARFLPKKNASG